MERRALITGATGFVGSHLAERLTRSGWRVRALVRSSSDVRMLDELDADVITGELRSAEDVARAAAGCEVVYHLAAATFESDEESFIRANVDGTRAVVEGAKVAGARRLVYMSSYAACGPSRQGQPRMSHEEPAPLTAYGRTKLAGEELVRGGRGGMEAVIIRAPTVYGPRDSALLSYFQLIGWWLAPAPGGGDRHLHLIFAPDLALALERAEMVAPGTYPVADPRVYRWSELVDAISHEMRRRPLRVRLPEGFIRVAARATERIGRATGRRVTFNREKAKEMLAEGWVCDLTDSEELLPHDRVTPLEVGIAETVRWYTREGWL